MAAVETLSSVVYRVELASATRYNEEEITPSAPASGADTQCTSALDLFVGIDNRARR